MALGTKRKAAQRLSVNPISLPSGAVQEFAGASAPEGWLMCDGAEVSKTTYAALYAVIADTYGTPVDSNNFVLPDLRGEFVRGLDDMGTAQGARGVDSGRALGSAQNQATAKNGLSASTSGTAVNGGAHIHDLRLFDGSGGTAFNYNASNGGITFRGSGVYRTTNGSNQQVITNNGSSHSHTLSATTTLSGDAETRPRNCAMNFIIKA